MKKTLTVILAYLCLSSTAVWSQDAVDFYNRGLRSSLANTRIDYFTKALQLNPDLVEAYEKRAIHYYYQWKFDKALQDYTNVIKLKPQATQAYLMRGLAYLKKGELVGAVADLSSAIELDPQMARAYGHRAEAYRLQGMADKALDDSTRAIHLRADGRTTASAYQTRAKAHQQLGHLDLSEADFNKSFELDPRYAIYRYLASSASLEEVRQMGLFGIIALIAVGIFQLSLRAPRKESRH